MTAPAVTEANVVIVGAGPRGVGVLERLAANLRQIGVDPTVHIHLVDPHPAGAGRVWRFDQSPLLRLNSMACDITLFTDSTSTCAGPVLGGPSMAEWGADHRDLAMPTTELADELREMTPTSFPTRRLGGEYLSWCYRWIVEQVGARAVIHEHRATATSIDDLPGGGQIVHLDDGAALGADAVVLTLGHLDTETPAAFQAVAAHAERFGLAYLPPAYASDEDLDAFEPGMDVIVRGFGLDFVDLLVLMTEGRGGTFVEQADGSLRYERIGAEPTFHIGSRRGVPYRSKLAYELIGDPPPMPRFFTVEAAQQLVAQHRPLRFREHVWPLIAKEIGWAYHHVLVHRHPDRVTQPWSSFDDAFAANDWGSEALEGFLHSALVEPADHLDFAALDRPLAGLEFDSIESLQAHLRAHITADVARRSDPRFSADVGAFVAFLSVFPTLPVVLGAPTLGPRSRVEDFDDWWFGFFSSCCSGPPPRRLEELLALSRAGVVSFLGADMWLRTDDGCFVAGSSSVPGATVSGTGLIDARLPAPTVDISRSEILRDLARRGEVAELILHDGDTAFAFGQIRVRARDQRVVRADGSTHPGRFALGQHSTSRAPAFARPRTNALALRHNDVAARAILELLAGPAPALAPTPGDSDLLAARTSTRSTGA